MTIETMVKHGGVALAAGVLILAACTTPSSSPSGTTTAPSGGQAAAVATATTAAAPGRSTGGTASTPAAATKVNLNTATNQQFLAIPNVGDRMLREFLEYRPYTSILQFRREIGKYVTADQVAAYEQYVYVPVNPNSADAATLQQLPGVDTNLANQLIAARPYASNDAFLTKLAQVVSAEQAAAARAYLTA